MVNVLIHFPFSLQMKKLLPIQCVQRKKELSAHWFWSSLDVDSLHLRALEDLANMRATHHLHLGDKGAQCLGTGYCCISRHTGTYRAVTCAAEKTMEHGLLRYTDKYFPHCSFIAEEEWTGQMDHLVGNWLSWQAQGSTQWIRVQLVVHRK